MRITQIVACSVAVLLVSHWAGAQDPPAVAQPTAQHQALEKFVGEWTTSCSVDMGTGEGDEMKSQGKVSCEAIGPFWIVSHATGEMMGTTVRAVQTIGYDTDKQHYIGTWIDSSNDHIWYYTGTMSDDGSKLTLNAKGPNFMGDGKLTKFRDVYEFKTKDHIVSSSAMQTGDGEWAEFMTGEMRRAAEE